ncbi:hypothetical protein BH10PSE18_BH10PSE18_27770 [soil metagenome]
MLAFPGLAQECKPTLVHMLMFNRGSAETTAEHIAAFAAWIDNANKSYPSYSLVIVEGAALKTDPRAQVLAEERAKKGAEMTRSFLRGEAPIEVSSHVFHVGEISNQGDYAAIQLVPKDVGITKCLTMLVAGR